MKIDFVVMAGGSSPEWYTPAIPNKALIPIHQKPSIEWILSAISSGIQLAKNTYPQLHCNTIVVGTKALRNSAWDKYIDTFVEVPEDNKLSQNVREGFFPVNGDYTIVLTGDIPCIEGGMIQELVHQCQKEAPFDLAVPLIRKEDVEKTYPGSKRTYGKIQEGHVKIANCFFIKTSVIPKIEEMMDSFIENRKNLVKLVFSFGLIPLFKLFVSKSISIPQLETVFTKTFHLHAKGFFTSYPQLAVDIDKQSDIQDIENYFKTRGTL